MKLKIFVASALLIFVFVVGNIIAFGLLQSGQSGSQVIKTTPDNNAIISTNPGTKDAIVQAAPDTSSNTVSSPSTDTSTQTPVQSPPPMTRRTRAS